MSALLGFWKFLTSNSGCTLAGPWTGTLASAGGGWK